MKKINSFYLSLAAGALLTLGACNSNDDDYIPQPVNEKLGLYVLNEGNYGSANASVGLYNFSQDKYETIISNIGDTGNDIGRYGSKLYIVVNGGENSSSGKLLVYNTVNDEKIGEIAIEGPRFIKFYKGKAYITHGENNLSQLDTGATATSLPAIQNTITVGRTPEQLTIFKDKIYVANSGALSSEGYDNRVSVVPVGSFSLERNIQVANNINVIDADTVNNVLYVNANTTYDNNFEPLTPSKLYAVNTSTDGATPFTFGAEQFFITGSTAMLISSNKTEGKSNILLSNNLQSQQFTDNAISTTEMATPYGITFVPELPFVVVADAKNYTSNGDLYLYDLRYQIALYTKFPAGIIPKKVALKY